MTLGRRRYGNGGRKNWVIASRFLKGPRHSGRYPFRCRGDPVCSLELYADATAASARAVQPFVLLFISLLIPLDFEFANGFHETTNAVATVIYTNSLPAHVG